MQILVGYISNSTNIKIEKLFDYIYSLFAAESGAATEETPTDGGDAAGYRARADWGAALGVVLGRGATGVDVPNLSMFAKVGNVNIISQIIITMLAKFCQFSAVLGPILQVNSHVY